MMHTLKRIIPVLTAAALLAGMNGCSPPAPLAEAAPTAPAATRQAPAVEPASSLAAAPAAAATTAPQPATSTPEPAPSATPTPEPTSSQPTLGSSRAQPPADQLVITGLNAVPPEDVAAEMYEFGKGGPGDLELCHPLPDVKEPQQKNGRLPIVVELYFCWPDPEGSVQFTVTDPKGKTDRIELPVRDLDVSEFPGGKGIQRYVLGSYQVDLSRPVGTYTFAIRGEKLSVSVTYKLSALKGPVIYRMYANPFGTGGDTDRPRYQLQLAGFAPNERLRLFLYDDEGTLVGWQKIQVNAKGRLWLEVERPREMDVMFGVTGPKSGAVREAGLRNPIVCPGSLPIRVKAGARALRDLNLRAKLEKDTEAGAPVRAGAQVDVIAGPYCREGAWWWAVSTDNGLGYTPESAGKEYLLEPAP